MALPDQIEERGKARTREDAAADNRRLMPLTAAEVDRWRAIFGDHARLRYACENGRTVGRSSAAARMMGVDAWREYVATGQWPHVHD